MIRFIHSIIGKHSVSTTTSVTFEKLTSRSLEEIIFNVDNFFLKNYFILHEGQEVRLGNA